MARSSILVDNMPPCIQLGIGTSTQSLGMTTTHFKVPHRKENVMNLESQIFADKEFWGLVHLLEGFCRHFEMVLWKLENRKKLGLYIWRCPSGATQGRSWRSYMGCGYQTAKLLLIRHFSYLHRKAVSSWRKKMWPFLIHILWYFSVTFYLSYAIFYKLLLGM